MILTLFIRAYRETLRARAPWAQDSVTLDSYLESVAASVKGEATSWRPYRNSLAARAWANIGQQGELTMEGLRE